MADGILKAQDRIEAVVGVNSLQGNMPLILHKNTTAASATAAATTQTLMSYSLPAGALNENGRGVKIRAVFSTAANTNTKTFLITFGSTTVSASAASAFANSTSAVLEATVIRTGAATQDAFGTFLTTDTTTTTTRGGSYAPSTPTETLSGAVTIAAKGTQGSASVDITCEYLEVTLI